LSRPLRALLEILRAGDDPYQLRRIAVLGDPGRTEFSAFLNETRFIAGGILIGWKMRERFLE